MVEDVSASSFSRTHEPGPYDSLVRSIRRKTTEWCPGVQGSSIPSGYQVGPEGSVEIDVGSMDIQHQGIHTDPILGPKPLAYPSF